MTREILIALFHYHSMQVQKVRRVLNESEMKKSVFTCVKRIQSLIAIDGQKHIDKMSFDSHVCLICIKRFILYYSESEKKTILA